jgi:hypothetical protein
MARPYGASRRPPAGAVGWDRISMYARALPWHQGFTWIAKIPISGSVGKNHLTLPTGSPDGLRRSEPTRGRRCGASGEEERIPRKSG